MLQLDLVNQQKTASAVREEGQRIIKSQTSVEASRSAQDLLHQLDDKLGLLESRLSHGVDEMTAALSEVRLSLHYLHISYTGASL